MPDPLVSVIVTVYNRQAELRRALESVAEQTIGDYECIVVDDASTEPVKFIVDEFDDRFSYVRRETNGGPTAARFTGCRHASGEMVLHLDSDNELLPWAFQRAAHYLHKHPEVDSAVGLYIFPEGLRVRVAGGEKVLGPDEYAERSTPGGADSVAFVRRGVVEEWLRLPGDYFNADVAFQYILRSSHLIVRVDEPWGRYHRSAAGRMSHRFDPRARGLDDIERFVGDLRPLVGDAPCHPIDYWLVSQWVRLMRAHRYRQAELLADWMHDRGISRTAAISRWIRWVVQRRIMSARRRTPVLVV